MIRRLSWGNLPERRSKSSGQWEGGSSQWESGSSQWFLQPNFQIEFNTGNGLSKGRLFCDGGWEFGARITVELLLHADCELAGVYTVEVVTNL